MMNEYDDDEDEFKPEKAHNQGMKKTMYAAK